jgi:hypothetical protein
MTTDEKPQIRKVWLPTEMKEAVAEFCWKNRTKPSPFIVELIQGYLDDPAKYAGQPIPPAGKDYSSVYIRDSIWSAAVEQAAQSGVRLSAVVRVAIAARLAEEGIPWDVTTARPKNEHIPIRE